MYRGIGSDFRIFRCLVLMGNLVQLLQPAFFTLAFGRDKNLVHNCTLVSVLFTTQYLPPQSICLIVMFNFDWIRHKGQTTWLVMRATPPLFLYTSSNTYNNCWASLLCLFFFVSVEKQRKSMCVSICVRKL